MVFFVLKSHRTLNLGDGIDEIAQRVARQRMVVTTGVHVFERAGLVKAAFGVKALEEKAFDLVGSVERVAFFCVAFIGEFLERAANVSGKRFAVTVEDVAEDEDFSRTEDVGRPPVESTPVERQPQVALALRSKAANRRAVKR